MNITRTVESNAAVILVDDKDINIAMFVHALACAGAYEDDRRSFQHSR